MAGHRLNLTAVRTSVGAVAAPAVVALASGCASPPTPTPGVSPEERFAAAYVQLLPVGGVMDAVAQQDAQWPLGDKAGMVSPTQLACMRSHLKSAEVTPRQRQTARDYARTHPDTLAEDLRVLEGGTARLFGQSVLQGAGAGPVPTAATPQESEAVTAFSTEPRFAPLRRFTGLDQVIGGAPIDARQRGREFGQRLLVPYLTDAFQRCHIPVKLLF